MFDVYKPGGGIGWATWPLLLAGIAVATGLAFLYQLFLGWVPFIFISALLTCGLGIVLAMLGGAIVNLGHVRNLILAALIGICLTITGVATKFWFQYHHDIDQRTATMMVDNNIPAAKQSQVRELIRRQVPFEKHLQDRADFGWNIDRGGGGGLPIKGILVYLIWLIEAGIIFYFAVATPINAAGEPYSEQTNKWANESQVIMTLPINNEEMISKIRTANTVDDLLEIPIPKTDQSNQFAVYTVNSIPGEEMEDAYLSVDLLTYSVNAKGEEENKQRPLVKHAILPTAKREQLIENAELLNEAIADYRESLAAELAKAENAEQLAGNESSADDYRDTDNLG